MRRLNLQSETFTEARAKHRDVQFSPLGVGDQRRPGISMIAPLRRERSRVSRKTAYREARTSTSSPTTRRRRHPREGREIRRLPSWRAMPPYLEDISSTTTTATTRSCRPLSTKRIRRVSRAFASGGHCRCVSRSDDG